MNVPVNLRTLSAMLLEMSLTGDFLTGYLKDW
jgi:hypothetical protein